MRPMVTGAGAGGGHLMDKQSLVPAVQELWNAWEIHFMILLSLSLQVFLFFFAGLRRHCSNQFLQTVLWLAYLAADSVAVFVLGHLAVRASEPGHELMAFWAPFVLIHLGGQDTITAYSKQDNELWRRHLLNLVLQAGIAGYVLAKASWPDARLRAAMVLMLVCGCFKYAERIVCLWAADTEYLRGLGQYSLWRKLKKGTDEEDTAVLIAKGSAVSPIALFWKAVAIVEDIISVDAPKGHKSPVVVDAPRNKADNITEALKSDYLLLDRLRFLETHAGRHRTYESVGALLECCYGGLYTKYSLRLIFIQLFDLIPYPILKTCLRILSLPCLLLSTTIAASIALALFTAVHKRDQLHTSSRVDITVTYVLLLGAIALDVSSAAIFIFRLCSFYLPCLAWCTKHWSQELAQYNIIHTAGMSHIGQFSGCDVSSTTITKESKVLILDTLYCGTRTEWSSGSTRGRLALYKYRMLKDHQYEGHYSADHLKSLKEILKADFPTSVLVLHIATDICYYGGDTTNCDHGELVKKLKQTSTELSNYVMYLVFKCGVTLTTDSQIVHDNVRREILDVLTRDTQVCSLLQSLLWCNLVSGPGNHKDDDTLKLFEAIKKQQEADSTGETQIRLHHDAAEEQQDSMDEIEMMHQESADYGEIKRGSKTKARVLPRAVAVAQQLLSIDDEAEPWQLIADVWAEMLYYTAPRCGSVFHYEHLSTGGEFITHVLVLMYLLGPFMPPPPS